MVKLRFFTTHQHEVVQLDGVRKKPWVWPLIAPSPTVLPRSLIPFAVVSTQPDPGGISVFRSENGTFASLDSRRWAIKNLDASWGLD